MELIEDPKIFRPLVEEAIKIYGFAPEHNVDWWFFNVEQNERPVFVSWPDPPSPNGYGRASGTGLMTQRAENVWYTFSEPLCPDELSGQKVVEFATHVLKNFPEIEEVVIEVLSKTRDDILRLLPNNLLAEDIYYQPVWPIMNMEKFDPLLSGSHFKGIRNAKSKFFREHKLEIVDAHIVEKKKLYQVIDNWAKHRKAPDDPLATVYHNLVAHEFKGCDTARVLMVDEEPVGLNAGWRIVNSNRFYHSVGIHNYSITELGFILYLENLEWIKNADYKTADMGGSEVGDSLFFKDRFLPESHYTTDMFSIVRR